MTDIITPQEYRDMIARKGSKPSKYMNKKVKGHVIEKGKKKEVTFDSQHEKAIYHDLHYRLTSGEIKQLDRQVRFKIVIRDMLVCTYIADFVIVDRYGIRQVIDAKSEFTRQLPVYKIKKKLLRAVLGVEIVEL